MTAHHDGNKERFMMNNDKKTCWVTVVLLLLLLLLVGLGNGLSSIQHQVAMPPHPFEA